MNNTICWWCGQTIKDIIANSCVIASVDGVRVYLHDKCAGDIEKDGSKSARGFSSIKFTILDCREIEQFRDHIEHDYQKHPTGCGGSFGEILCYEIHESALTFKWLAKKWKISVAFLGELIADHCRKL